MKQRSHSTWNIDVISELTGLRSILQIQRPASVATRMGLWDDTSTVWINTVNTDGSKKQIFLCIILVRETAEKKTSLLLVDACFRRHQLQNNSNSALPTRIKSLFFIWVTVVEDKYMTGDRANVNRVYSTPEAKAIADEISLPQWHIALWRP